MPSTTTIRVDTATHAELLELSEQAGTSLFDTVRAATQALRRQQFAASVSEELQALREDPEAWSSYLAEADQAVSDGIGQ